MGSRRRSISFAVAVSAALLVPLAIFGGTSFAKGFAAASTQYQYGHKVTICHHTHSKTHPWVTITIDQHAVQAHLKHGDKLGACSNTSTSSSQGHKGSHHKGSHDAGHGHGGGGGGNPGQGGNGSNGNGGDQGNHGQGKDNGGGNGHGHP